jgi:hypothetical protein
MKKAIPVVAPAATVISAHALAKSPAKNRDYPPMAWMQPFSVYNLHGEFAGSDPDPLIQVTPIPYARFR